MKKIIVVLTLLICSVVVSPGQNPLSIQPYATSELRLRCGNQSAHSMSRMAFGLLCDPSKDVAVHVEFNGVKSSMNYAYGRGHKTFGKWELSALAGRHLNPVGWTVPSPADRRLPRPDIAYEPFLPTTYATGVGVWVKYDSWASLRVSSFDSTDASVCLIVAGISQYWQDGVGYGGGVNLGDFLHKFNRKIGYGGYELLPRFACVDLEEGRDPCAYGLDVSSPYPVQLHWLTEGTSVDTWHSFGASVQYLKRSFVKAIYDGRFKTARVDISFYAAW